MTDEELIAGLRAERDQLQADTDTSTAAVRDILAELQDAYQCRCPDDYTGRGLHDSNCEHYLQPTVEVLKSVLAGRDGALEWVAELQRYIGHGVLELTAAGNQLAEFENITSSDDQYSSRAYIAAGHLRAALKGEQQ